MPDLIIETPLQIKEGAANRTLNVTDLSAASTGAGTQTTLAAVLAELGQKLEPADIAALGTAAKQDASKAVLDSILASVDGLEGFTDGIEAGLAGLGTQTTLAAVLTELGQKLEPADVAALSTAAKQDAAKTTLDSILTALSSVAVTGPLTNSQLRASALPVNGTVTVGNPTTNPETGLAKDATLTDRFGGGKLAKTFQVTASGATTVLTPTTGKGLRVLWVSAINDPDQAVSPRIRVGFVGAAGYLYSAYAIAHWEVFVGAVNQALQVDLDQAADVAVTIHYQEI